MIDEEGHEHPDLDGDVTIGRIDCMDQRRDVPVAQDRNELPCPDRRSNDQMLTAMRCPLRKVLQPANFVRHCTLIAARQGRAVRPLCPLSERKFRRRCHSPRTTSRSLRRSASGKALNSLVHRSTAGALHRQRGQTAISEPEVALRYGARSTCGTPWQIKADRTNST